MSRIFQANQPICRISIPKLPFIHLVDEQMLLIGYDGTKPKHSILVQICGLSLRHI